MYGNQMPASGKAKTWEVPIQDVSTLTHGIKSIHGREQQVQPRSQTHQTTAPRGREQLMWQTGQIMSQPSATGGMEQLKSPTGMPLAPTGRKDSKFLRSRTSKTMSNGGMEYNYNTTLPPHNYNTRNAESPPNTSLIDTKEKQWVDSRSKINRIMLSPKDLSITWAEDPNYWSWIQLKESANEPPIDAVELLDVCWLDVNGKFDTRKLTPGQQYKVAFVVKLQDPAYGWDVPVNFKLVVPNSPDQVEKVDMRFQRRYQWVEIPAGEFIASPQNAGEIVFSMTEVEGGEWKKGLVLKGVVIRPSN